MKSSPSLTRGGGRAVTSSDFARGSPWPHLTTASNLHKKSFENWCIGDGDYQLCSADLWISSSLNVSFWMKDVGKHYTFWRCPTVYSCFGFVLQIMTDTPKYITSLTLKEYSGQDRQCWDTCPVFGQLWIIGGITFPVGNMEYQTLSRDQKVGIDTSSTVEVQLHSHFVSSSVIASFSLIPLQLLPFPFGLKPNPQTGRTARPATESSGSSSELAKRLRTMESPLSGDQL